MTKKTTLYIVQAAVIAALYATLTTAQALLIPGSTSMAVQFRVAEAMTILAFFTPVAIPGLTVGCILANNGSHIPEKELRELMEFISAQFFYICAEWKRHFVTDHIDFYC